MLESRLFALGDLARQALLSVPAGLLGSLLADLLGPLGHIRQDRHPIGQHLQEAAAHEQGLGAVAVVDPQLARLERRHQGRVTGQYAEVAFGASGQDEVGLALEEAALDAHYPELDGH